MTTDSSTQARIQQIRQWSPIWIVPIAAILIGLWMLYSHYQQQGELLTLIADNAEGIVAGKTQIKSRSVDVGQVVSVELSEDLKQVIMKARMKPAVTSLLNEGSQFWVVKPNIGRSGVTGLNTLLSGVYIELQPGDAKKTQLEFALLDAPPVAPADAPGIRVILTSSDTTGIAVGDPVLYRGYEVGTVELSEFDIEQRMTRYQLYVREPYHALITENIRFWLSSGLSFDLTAEGLRVDVGSATTLLSGGVSFDLMDGWPAGKMAEDGMVYQLFPDRQSIQEGMYQQFVEYLVFFDESVRGLKSGAPVEFRGVRVGTVASVPFFFSMEKPFDVSLNQGVPVLIRIEAGRLYENLTLPELKQELENAIQRGLQAMLKPGNLLTGALYIELDILDTLPTDEPQQRLLEEQRLLAASANYPVLPSTRSGLSNIEQKVLMALDKINNLPLQDVLVQGNQTLQAADKLLQQAERLMLKLDDIASQPELQQLPEKMQQSLDELQRMLAGLSPGSAAYDSVNNNLQALEQVLKDMQPVLKTLNEKSNALIFNAVTQDDPQPKKAKP